ncbi:sugar O-acyltransferase [uncultured Bacteroides sp.]|uniref:PglD-related sugar-binding protein n=1 Tax=uncultured Bacteroides sp. TaxID=162156 RepID=UPI00280AF0D9|nr:sugar O-acyltransferase [uncultured Bacteroides sp.]
MKDLIIVCAGGFGKEAVVVAEQMNEIVPQWNILGFIDDTIEVGTEIFRGYKIIGSIKDWQPEPQQYFAMGISTPQAKEKLYNLIHEKGGKFATLIKPATIVPQETEIGEGCVISGWIGINVVLGKCVHIAGSMVGGASIGDFSTTTGFANIAGAHLGNRVFVGSHAVILNGKKVGDDAIVCAGSIVFSNVKAGTKVFGNPAKKADF